MRPSQRRGRIGGLRGQLLLGLIGLLVLTLALVAIATVQVQKRHLQQAVADEARRHAGWLASIDEAERDGAAASLEEQPGVLYAGELDEQSLPAISETQRVWIANFDSEVAMWAVVDESAPSVVVLSLADAQAGIDAGRRTLTLYLISTLLFVILVGYAFFSFVVVRPLRALGVATSRAAEGDLASPITVLPRNEFGEVGRQFNKMLEQLDNQRAELEEQLDKIQKAHHDLQQTQDSLIRSEKLASVGHLAAGVAHEVGNPLAAVMGYTDLLRDRGLSEEDADDLADRSLVQLKRIRRIIRQLLDYSRPDSDDEPTAVAIDAVIDEAVHLVQATPAGRDVTIEVHGEDDLPAVIAIHGELVQVMVNLLLNAVKAMKEEASTKAQITVSTSLEDAGLIIDVKDSGPGIDPEIADQIFDPFFTTRDPGEGTGLGLAITQRLVARIGAEIELVPSDEGAHFRIRLEAEKE